MKKRGLLNPALSAAIARLGHTDTFVVADCGLPIPAGVPVIDLALVFGVPTFDQTLRALLDEVVVEGAMAASEARGAVVEDLLTAVIGVLEWVDHEELKRRVADASFVVRTGENTPYANVILRSGVPF